MWLDLGPKFQSCGSTYIKVYSKYMYVHHTEVLERTCGGYQCT